MAALEEEENLQKSTDEATPAQGKKRHGSHKLCDSGVFEGWLWVSTHAPPQHCSRSANEPMTMPLIDYLRRCYGGCTLQELQVKRAAKFYKKKSFFFSDHLDERRGAPPNNGFPPKRRG